MTTDDEVGVKGELDLQFLLDKVRRNKGVDFSLYRPGTLRRRIVSRFRAVGCSDCLDYIAYLNKDPEEYNRLIEAVTINVTEFFRNPETFAALEEQVIPELVRRKTAQGKKVLRVWSAGTSSGEEAYSLALLFLQEEIAELLLAL